jgi:Putative Flp pilus-assembly TadE/G-like
MPKVARAARGSVLMLMPAGVLVVLLLGSIAFDFSLVYLRQRQAQNVAVGAANDAVTAGVDRDLLRRTGLYEIAEPDATAVAVESIERSDIADIVTVRDIRVAGNTVTVELVVEVEYVFARALPFAPSSRTVDVRATAVADAG